MKVFIGKSAIKELLSADSLPLWMVVDLDIIKGKMNIINFTKERDAVEKVVALFPKFSVSQLGSNLFEMLRQKIFDEVRNIENGVGFDIPDEIFDLEIKH